MTAKEAIKSLKENYCCNRIVCDLYPAKKCQKNNCEIWMAISALEAQELANNSTKQPEIIRCKDCFCGHGEVWLSGNGEVDAYGYCGRTNLRVLPYDYCSWAERKTNGSD